ncbi:hypothetical protein CYY_010490 [Polysphondylium violaceum]|uniref:Uncharacterized protein n=1 Tax=Polysphondylium violaceum TaxID=133409 RepID=A0A8J4PJI8_9MYCE|nr:hypothetical protein CYY_010490 [Polysphondylium violaceum]
MPEADFINEKKWDDRFEKAKLAYKQNKFVRWFKSKRPFPWIYVFSFIVNIPMLVALVILTGVRWTSDCSFVGGFLIVYIIIFIINLLYTIYFHKTMKLKKPRTCISVMGDCGFSSFFLFSAISVVIFIICEFLRRGTEYTQCYKSNSDIYHLLRGAAGIDIFFLCGFYIINFFNVCCSCYKVGNSNTSKKRLPK